MSDSTKGRAPDFYALNPVQHGKGDDAKTYWNRIGAAWLLKEKEGISVKLDSTPIDGEFVLMPPKPESGGD